MTTPSISESTRVMLNKVPEVTIYFWIIKILCTTVGETAADFLNTNLHLGLTGTTCVMGGLLMGAGFLMLFRHRASLGGVGVVALVLQQDRGWRAGKVQMAVDCAIVLVALFVVEPTRIGYSLVGAVVLNLTLAVNHKPGRYIAM